MSKLAPVSIKYLIRARFTANGIVEKPDVIGAIFGQSEGLIGKDLDLKELQRTGKLGRIDVIIKNEKGRSHGEILIPSALDAAETSLIAAAIETVERIGPCASTIKLETIEDVRKKKREQIIKNAKKIMKELMEKEDLDIEKLSEDIKEEIRAHEITTYRGLPCGPDVIKSDEIIVVEGRADVIKLLKYGIKNAIAMKGTSVPRAIIELSREKTVTVFVDGDRGGLLNAKSLMDVADVDFIVVAPEGKEVEELSKKEVYKLLRNKVPASSFSFEKYKITERKKETLKRGMKVEKRKESFSHRRIERRKIKLDPELREMFKKVLEEINGSRGARIYDNNRNLLGKVPIRELPKVIKKIEKPYIIILDGKIDHRLNALAKESGVVYLVGKEKDAIISPVKIISREDLE